jgi:ABC-type branched-subunit amino acid transport system permease subunit
MLVRSAPYAIAALCVALGTTFPWLKTPLVVAMSYGLAALGIGVLLKAGQVSFGHAAFACLSGYALVMITHYWPGIDGSVLLLAGAVVGLLAGAVVGLFVVRYREIFFGMLNLALSMVLFASLGKFYHVTGGTDGLRLPRPPMFGVALERAAYEMTLLLLGAGLVVTACALARRYLSSPAGQALAALKTNEVRLEYLGISAKSVFYKGYVVSATLCGLSGALFALVQGMVTPEMGYWVNSGEYVFIAILGGTLHPAGAFAGALAYQFLKMVSAATLTGAWQMVIGVVLLLLIFLAPTGIVAWLAQIDDWLIARKERKA